MSYAAVMTEPGSPEPEGSAGSTWVFRRQVRRCGYQHLRTPRRMRLNFVVDNLSCVWRAWVRFHAASNFDRGRLVRLFSRPDAQPAGLRLAADAPT